MAVPESDLRRLLERFVRHVAIERGLSVNTVTAYRRDLEGYLDALDERGVADADQITPAHVTDFGRALREGESPLAASSTARILSSVRGFHKFLLEEGVVDADAAVDVRPPKQSARLPQAITIEQMASVLDACGGDDDVDLRDRALLEFLYATGARVSEATALNVDDVSASEGGTASAVRLFGKGGKQRIVPLGSMAREAIDSYLVRVRPGLSRKGRGTPALFLGARGGRLSRQHVWLIVQSRAEAAGLGAHVSPHTFRHSFATHLLEGGADVRVVQELLGHASVATTQIYTLVTADTLRDMYTTAHPRAVEH